MVKIAASTNIQCPAGTKRHAVTLHDDGSFACTCGDGIERGGMLAGRIMLGMAPPEGVRGCGALIALASGARSLLPLVRGTKAPEYGLWGELIFAYGANPVFRGALDLIEREQPERATVKQLLMAATEKANYGHALGKRRFREGFKACWDVPESDLDRFVVSCFDDDPWSVPYQPGWKEHVANEGLAVVDGKVVCGRSASDPAILYAVVPHQDGEAHWVRAHRMNGRTLEIATP